MNGAQWLVRTLKECGVENVFVLCGNGLNPFLDACLDHQVNIIDVRNEQAASYMADTWGRLTRRLGVVAVSSGPGHTNALTGLANSWWDGGPMLLVSGSSDNRSFGSDCFQELDQVGMASPVCKYARRIDHIETLPAQTHKAISAAMTSRPGPVHLTIPENVLRAEISDPPRLRLPAEVIAGGAGRPDDVRQAVELLHTAERPVAVVGSGAFYAQAWPALRAFATMTGVPIFSLLWDRGCIEEAIPEYMGIVSTEVNAGAELISQADVILTLGARVDYRLDYGAPPMTSGGVRFVRVDADPSEVNRVMSGHVSIVGNPRTVLEQINDEGSRRRWDHSGWLDRIRNRRETALNQWTARPVGDSVPMPSLRLCMEIRPFLRSDVTFLLDGGNIGRWAHMLLFDRHPSHWFTCGISGVVGWGLPGAIAAKLARPDKPVLLLTGDGSAGFTLGDIETAVRFSTPYVAVVSHDSAWGIVVDGQPEGRKAGSQLGEIRFDRVAQALGARGVFIEDASQIAPAIEEGLKADVVTFIHVPTTHYGIRTYTHP